MGAMRNVAPVRPICLDRLFYRSMRVDRMIDDSVRSTPSVAPILSSSASRSLIDGDSTTTIMSKLPLTECSVRTCGSARRLWKL